jgi:hypothetical protein
VPKDSLPGLTSQLVGFSDAAFVTPPNSVHHSSPVSVDELVGGVQTLPDTKQVRISLIQDTEMRFLPLATF